MFIDNFQRISNQTQIINNEIMKSTVFWDITSCSPVKFNRRFGGTYGLYLQGRISLAKYRNVGSLSTDYTAIYPIVYSRRRDSYRKQSKPRVATADSMEWTKRAVSSVYSLHSDAR
jgi:hypothetical protein